MLLILFYTLMMTSLSRGVLDKIPNLTEEQKKSVKDPRHLFFERLIQKKGQPLFLDDVIPSVGIVEPLVELTEEQTRYVVRKYRIKAISPRMSPVGDKSKTHGDKPPLKTKPTSHPPSSSTPKTSTPKMTFFPTTVPSKELSHSDSKVILPTTMETSTTASPVTTSVQVTTQLPSNDSSRFTFLLPSMSSTSFPFKTSTTMPPLSSFRFTSLPPSTQSTSFPFEKSTTLSSSETQSSTMLAYPKTLLMTGQSTSSATLFLNLQSTTPSALLTTHVMPQRSSPPAVLTQKSTQDVSTYTKSLSTRLATSTFETPAMSTNPKSTSQLQSTEVNRSVVEHISTTSVPLVSLEPSPTLRPTKITKSMKQSSSSNTIPPLIEYSSTQKKTPLTQSVSISVKLTSDSTIPSIDLFGSTPESLTQLPTKTEDEVSYPSKPFSSSSSTTYSTYPMKTPTKQLFRPSRLLSTLLLKPSSSPKPILMSKSIKQAPYSSRNTPFTKYLSTIKNTPSTKSFLTSIKLTSDSTKPSIDPFESTSESLTQSTTLTDAKVSYTSKSFSSSSSSTTYSTYPIETPTKRLYWPSRLLSTLLLKSPSTPKPILMSKSIKQSPSSSRNPPFTTYLSIRMETPSTQSVLNSIKLTSDSTTTSIDPFGSTSESLAPSTTKTDVELSHSSKRDSSSSSSSTYLTKPMESPTKRLSSSSRLLGTLRSFSSTMPFSLSSLKTETEHTLPTSTISVSSSKSSSSIMSSNIPTSGTLSATSLVSHSSSSSPLSSANYSLSARYSTFSSPDSASDSNALATSSSQTGTETIVQPGYASDESWCETERLNTSIVASACNGGDYKTVAYIVLEGKLNQVISHVEVPMTCDPDPDGPCYGADNSCTCCLTKASIDIVSLVIETGEMSQISEPFDQCLCC